MGAAHPVEHPRSLARHALLQRRPFRKVVLRQRSLAVTYKSIAPCKLSISANVDSARDRKPYLWVFDLVESGAIWSLLFALTNESNTFHTNHIVTRGASGACFGREAVDCEFEVGQLPEMCDVGVNVKAVASQVGLTGVVLVVIKPLNERVHASLHRYICHFFLPSDQVGIVP